MIIAGQLVQFVMKDVDELSHCPIYMWGDNRAALSWCSSVKIDDIYVFRRVTQLRDLCPNVSLKYVKSSDNPADLLTKDISAEELLRSKLWWQGPQWLLNKSEWPG